MDRECKQTTKQTTEQLKVPNNPLHTQQKTLLLELSLVTQKIHLSIDLWSGGGVAYIGVIAHYFDQYNQLKAPVLIFYEIKGSHTGENQAGYVMKAIVDFGITSKLGYFMLNNASNNDTLMNNLQKGIMLIQSYFY